MPKPNKSWYTLKNEADVIKVWVHGDISAWDIDATEIIAALQVANGKEVELRMLSGGGSVYQGLAMYNALKAHKGRVVGIVDGMAASIATYVLLACDSIRMPENAMLMIHNPAIGAWGGEKEINSALQQLQAATKTISEAYAEKSGQPLEEVLTAMESETWFTAQAAKDWGLVDEVVEAVDLSNSLQSFDESDFKNFKQAPSELMNSLTLQSNEPTPLAASAKPNEPQINKPKQVSDMPKPNEELQNAVKAENQRQADIRALCAQHKVSEALTNEMLTDLSCSVGQASTKILESIGTQSAAGQQEPEANLTATHMRLGNGNHVKDELQNALNARCGVADLEKDNSFGHESLLNMARACLDVNARSAITKNELVNRAFNSGDFGDIITEGIRTVMRDEAQARAPMWRELANVENLTDFRETELVMVNDAPDLMKVSEDGEYKAAVLKGSGERIQLATFGREIQFTRHAIINDEIGLVAKVPRKFMQSGYRLSDKLMFNAILAGKMADGGNVFKAGKDKGWGNFINDIPAGDYAAMIMALHKVFATATTIPLDGEAGQGDALDLRGELLIASPDHASMFEAVLNTASKPDAFNPAYKKFGKVIETARVGDVNGALALTGKDFDTVVMGFLDGQQDPWLETGDGWSSDGAKFRITYDLMSKVLDRRGIAQATFK
ncbi:ClpP-like prohead protease/major capsid protein fusion protein [Vibrio splendidus]|uniref:ClpP-like prohead protease/major capsid protein fusion protein n=1 Tax=Vibrio splendidus TaxID=29497 RepID=UPI0006CA0385|nr:ClpP-like prohead protease/major capsid protein fusion protein [Vibrio splendidus]KPL99287.1 ATP-dependent protease [Vibrio splendidus]